MRSHILQENPSKDDTAWEYTAPQNLQVPRRADAPVGKFIQFTAEKITLGTARFPSNRILHSDDPSKFILLSFGGLRFPDTPLRATSEYISRLMKAGLFLNGIQYRFYHHSNSQLRSRSCFLREANSDAELDERIYRLGDFGKIMNVAKRAKRIGLLFSEAQVDYQLDPKYTADISDIKSGDEIFSDGCGLISQRLSIQLSRAKKIVFRGNRYTPTVVQIRYLGYKGVLMLHPELDKEKKHLVQFRKSMKKFSTTENHTFSVVDYSKPYAFGRLNNDIIVLLSSLGITNEKLLAKQQAYFHWISSASEDPTKAVDLSSSMDRYALAERVLLNGLNDPEISQAIRSLQMSEIANFRNDRDKIRSRMIIEKSRLIFGVCDPFQVLKEGEVHIRITMSRKGPSTPIHGDVLVVRNPCLHPGDCLKLRAVHNNKLSHLVDCIVFASVARPGHHAAPSMSSGGDLDGDKYFVCWDPDLIPTRVAESYDYPPNKEPVSKKVTRADLANHFSAYNNASLARVAALHAKWVRNSPKGALCTECQELNALHSQSVDGAGIKIPDRLTTPPELNEPFILDILADASSDFAAQFAQLEPARTAITSTNAEEGKKLMDQLLQSNQRAISEYELFCLAYRIAQKHSLDLRHLLNHIDLSALTTKEKYALSLSLNLTPEEQPYVWNSLFRSDILTARDLYQRSLNRPFSLQRLYSSKVHGLASFFEYLRMATQEYTRKLLILKTDERFAVGIFMRGSIPWDEDPEVNENVVLCSFMPQTGSTLATLRPCTVGYRLHCSDANFQLYNKQRADTFVFINRPPAASGSEVATSMALQKFSVSTQRQLGRINRTPVKAIELHVVSNRDRIAHQLFDMWFEHVPTEEFVRRFERQAVAYRLNDIRDVNWEEHPKWLRDSFFPVLIEGNERPQRRSARHTVQTMSAHLSTKTSLQVERIMEFALDHHAEDEAFHVFNFLIAQQPLRREAVIKWIERYPPFVFALLRAYPPSESNTLPEKTAPLARHIVQNIIRSANDLGIVVLVALEKMSATIAGLQLDEYFDLLMMSALSIRSQQLVQEVLLVLNDCRIGSSVPSPASKYGYKHALAIAFDRAEEAADECPCTEDGKPRKQRSPPTHVRLAFIEGHPHQVKAVVRVDAKTQVRLHSHIRLQAASHPENRWIEAPVLDGVVVQAMKGELNIDVLHPPPPEMENMDWNMYNAGSVATSKAMMDAVLRLLDERGSCCRFYSIVTGDTDDLEAGSLAETLAGLSEPLSGVDHLNLSQIQAVNSFSAPLSLIWGPPGTGKTTVVIQILRKIIETSEDDIKVLVTASTHNAVDNVLERFVELNRGLNLVREEQILRVATDQSKVNKELQNYTIDARVGGDVNQNSRLVKQAQARVSAATLVFTTCAGAGLGILRKVDFDIAIIDEASQVTEPCAIIPLVKGIKRAILVGDHVQLRPTVRKMGKALEYDVSLLERLYTHVDASGIVKTMLDVQYRSPQELNAFPAREFYENRLTTGITNSADVLRVLTGSSFPWPLRGGNVVPTVFIQCSAEEDMGGMSKSNLGQAEIIEQILPLLTAHRQDPGAPSSTDSEDAGDELKSLKITVLSPYSKQIQMLHHRLPSSVPCHTIDSFQGRESDIVIFSSVRCNAEGDIGFVDDERRLNVMWTRAKLALIIVGDRRTMGGNALWKRALDACTEVNVAALGSK